VLLFKHYPLVSSSQFVTGQRTILRTRGLKAKQIQIMMFL